MDLRRFSRRADGRKLKWPFPKGPKRFAVNSTLTWPQNSPQKNNKWSEEIDELIETKFRLLMVITRTSWPSPIYLIRFESFAVFSSMTNRSRIEVDWSHTLQQKSAKIFPFSKSTFPFLSLARLSIDNLSDQLFCESCKKETCSTNENVG